MPSGTMRESYIHPAGIGIEAHNLYNALNELFIEI